MPSRASTPAATVSAIGRDPRVPGSSVERLDEESFDTFASLGLDPGSRAGGWKGVRNLRPPGPVTCWTRAVTVSELRTKCGHMTVIMYPIRQTGML
jgi:hypothetical protein